ncbi:MAG TPA: HEPN domain-containing protein [Terriglobia bacterium]|nr:HEPN domain-containing protein [Terriglobia bacterium]
MNRTDLQTLAEERLTDARALFASGRFSAAYYLAGYAIECALKACIEKRTKAEDFPIKDSARTVYIHDLAKLAQAAEVKVAIEQLAKHDKAFGLNWAFVAEWSEESRYNPVDQEWDKLMAEVMLDAVNNPQHGVLQCLKQYW